MNNKTKWTSNKQEVSPSSLAPLITIMNIGKAVREIRKQRGFSKQSHLAKAVGISSNGKKKEKKQGQEIKR